MSAVVKLCATILSDGDIDFKRYTVSFTESREVVASITAELQEIDGVRINWKIDRHHNSYRARAYSKKLVEILQKFTKTFRTRPHGVHPLCSDSHCKECGERNARYKEIVLPDMSEKEMTEFLRYYATCDGGPQFRVRQRKSGSIQLDYAIKIGCCNPYLCLKIGEMLKQSNITVAIRTDGIEIRDLKSITTFYQKIGFLEASKVRKGKLFRNYKKNSVLRLIILCGILTERGHWITRNFKNVLNTQKFLVDLISILERDSDGKLITFLQENAHTSLSPVDISRVSSVEPVPAWRQAGRSNKRDPTV